MRGAVLFAASIIGIALLYQRASVYYYDDPKKFFILACVITIVSGILMFIFMCAASDAIAAYIAAGG